MRKKISIALLVLGMLAAVSMGLEKTQSNQAWQSAAPAEPEIDEWQILPREGSEDVHVYPVLTLTGAEAIEEIQGAFYTEEREIIGGEFEIVDGTGARFWPYQVLQPGHTYEWSVQVNGTAMTHFFTVSAMALPDEWIEVSLGTQQWVRVWQGGQITQQFPCSGGLPDSPSLLGVFELQERGESFYSHRFCEGARYWIRIQDQFLFHSVPRDKQQHMIQSELDKIGTAASHGCIRLKDEDAQWLYEQMPEGTMVIIHPAVSDPVGEAICFLEKQFESPK